MFPGAASSALSAAKRLIRESMTIHGLLEKWAMERPDRTAILDGRSSLTFAQWHRASEHLAGRQRRRERCAFLVQEVGLQPEARHAGCGFAGWFGLLRVEVRVRRVLEQAEQGVGVEGGAHGDAEASPGSISAREPAASIRAWMAMPDVGR